MFYYTPRAFSSILLTKSRRLSMCSEDVEMAELLEYLGKLKNYEKLGVPKGAGTDSYEGFDLGRMRRLLNSLGNPQSKFKAVHIAGTKGKGSTAAFLANILRAGGYSVGCYTSPHLQTIRERITFGRKENLVSPQALKNVFLRLRKVLDQSIHKECGYLSHFEIFTALAFSFFAEERVDIAIVEAGLGGSRDATNVFSSSNVAASVITTVGSEHLAALGGSLESIAEAKSGIIKEGRPVIIGGPFEPHIESILRRKASKIGSPVISSVDSGIRSIIKATQRKDDDIFHLCDLCIHVEKSVRLHLELNNVRVRMLGLHQLQNVVTAICTALYLREEGWCASDQSIRNGIESTQLLGRSQFLTVREVEALGLSGLSILIDGAHTAASAKSLADTVRLVHQNLPVAVVVAMACDKDHFAFAKQFLLGVKPEVVVLTEVNIAGGGFRKLPASLLQDSWIHAANNVDLDNSIETKHGYEQNLLSSQRKSNNIPVIAECHEKSIIESIKLANELLSLQTTKHPGLIVVTGSLHIVSAVLASIRR